MAELPDLVPPWDRLPLVHAQTNLLPEPTVDAMATEITQRVVESPELSATIAEAVENAGAGADRFTAGTWTPGSTVRPLVADKTRLVTFGSSTPNMMTTALQAAVSSAGWGITCTSAAQPGERYQHTLARTGILNAVLTFPDNTIPASGAVTVGCSLPNQNLMKTYAGTLATNGQTIAGTLALSGGGGTFTFTRTASGTAVVVSGPVEFSPTVRDAANVPQAPFYRDTIAVIDTGKNNVGTAGIAETINAANDLVLEWLVPQRKFVVLLGMFNNRNANATEKANVAAINAHRKRVSETNAYVAFADVQSYITSEQVWTDTNLAPTANDLNQQAAGVKPDSLSLDDAHLNEVGLKAAVDHVVMPKLAELLALPYSPPNPPDITTDLLALWDAAGLALGSLPSWSPSAGSRSDMTVTETTTAKQPTVVEATVGGASRKVVRFNPANAQMLRTAVFASEADDVLMPATEVMLVKANTGTSFSIMNGSGVAGRSGYLYTQLNTAGQPQMGGGAVGELTGSTALQNGTWHVVASVYNGSSSRLYLDGALIGSGTVGVANAATAKLPRVTIGANSGGNTSYFNGDMAKLALFDRALSSSDVAAITQEWRAALGLS